MQWSIRALYSAEYKATGYSSHWTPWEYKCPLPFILLYESVFFCMQRFTTRFFFSNKWYAASVFIVSNCKAGPNKIQSFGTVLCRPTSHPQITFFETKNSFLTKWRERERDQIVCESRRLRNRQGDRITATWRRWRRIEKDAKPSDSFQVLPGSV